MFFFFSSRRRHTRSLCDWSSDVCSSDLRALGKDARRPLPRREALRPERQQDVDHERRLRGRSEERRVGKERKSRWWPEHEKKDRKIRALGRVTAQTTTDQRREEASTALD